eukprot:288041_1
MASLHLLADNSLDQQIGKYICTLVLAHNTIVFVICAYTTIHNKKRDILQLELLSLLSLFTTVIFSTSITFMLYPFSNNHKLCQWIINGSTIAYSLSKLSLYNFFLERLYIICNTNHIPENITTQNTTIQLSIGQTQIQISRILLCIWAILISLLFCLTGWNGFYQHELESCVSKYPMFVLGIVAIGDLIISLTISIMLSRRLIMFIGNHKDERHIFTETICIIIIISYNYNTIKFNNHKCTWNWYTLDIN